MGVLTIRVLLVGVHIRAPDVWKLRHERSSFCQTEVRPEMRLLIDDCLAERPLLQDPCQFDDGVHDFGKPSDTSAAQQHQYYLQTVEPRKLEHDRPPTPNQGKKE